VERGGELRILLSERGRGRLAHAVPER